MKIIIKTAAILGLLGVILGAFGAHAIKPILTIGQAETFDTAVKYQFIHTLSILILVILRKQFNIKWWQYAAYLHIIGIIIFSGSLYLLSLKQVLGLHNWTFLGPMTPIGGLCFILGWLFLFIGCFKIPND